MSLILCQLSEGRAKGQRRAPLIICHYTILGHAEIIIEIDTLLHNIFYVSGLSSDAMVISDVMNERTLPTRILVCSYKQQKAEGYATWSTKANATLHTDR